MSRFSYLAPILRSVGITEPIKITLINVGLGKHLHRSTLLLVDVNLEKNASISSAPTPPST
jgi:hypothetical protein